MLHTGPVGVRGQVTLAGRYSLLLDIFNMAFHFVTSKQLVWFLTRFPEFLDQQFGLLPFRLAVSIGK